MLTQNIEKKKARERTVFRDVGVFPTLFFALEAGVRSYWSLVEIFRFIVFVFQV